MATIIHTQAPSTDYTYTIHDLTANSIHYTNELPSQYIEAVGLLALTDIGSDVENIGTRLGVNVFYVL